MAAKAKSSGSTTHSGRARKKRPGVHSKKKCSKSKKARNYKKLVKQLGKTRLLSRQYTEVLLKKADRFVDKKSIRKEKSEIKN